jgi:spore coat polysaccharide biosynthesis protein SpsF
MELNKNEIGILIAVRMKSSRLGSKAMGDIVGKPMISHLIERMRKVKNAGHIILCTSTNLQDKVLLEVAEKENIPGFAGSELDVMKRFIDAAELHHLKHIVRVTGDNPLTDPVNIDRMIEAHVKGGYEFTKSEFMPLGVNAEVISVETLKRAYDTAEDTSLTEYMTTYLKRPDYFKILTVESNDPIFEGKALVRLTVDYEEDIKVMNIIYGDLYHQNPDFTIKDVIKYLNEHPEILEINSDVKMIPLPQIHFKGEKKFDKKIIIIGNDTGALYKETVQRIKSLDQYDIVGFIQDGGDFQYSLAEGIPTLGLTDKLHQIDLEAGYFVNIVSDPKRKDQLNKTLLAKGLEEITLN